VVLLNLLHQTATVDSETEKLTSALARAKFIGSKPNMARSFSSITMPVKYGALERDGFNGNSIHVGEDNTKVLQGYHIVRPALWSFQPIFHFSEDFLHFFSG
jgi:hypothetical protein